MEGVFVVRMKGRGEASRSKHYTAMLGACVLTFSDGVCIIDDPDLARFILSNLKAHYSVENSVTDEVIHHEIPVPNQEDIANLPSDEDIPGVMIGETVEDEATVAPKTVVAVSKRKLKPKKKKGR